MLRNLFLTFTAATHMNQHSDHISCIYDPQNFIVSLERKRLTLKRLTKRHFHLIFMRYIILFVYLEMGVRALARLYIRPISFAIASFGIRVAWAADESGRCPVVRYHSIRRRRSHGTKEGGFAAIKMEIHVYGLFSFFFFFRHIPLMHVRGPCHLRARRSVQDGVLVISPLCGRYHACTQIGPIRSLQAGERVSLVADITS